MYMLHVLVYADMLKYKTTHIINEIYLLRISKWIH